MITMKMSGRNNKYMKYKILTIIPIIWIALTLTVKDGCSINDTSVEEFGRLPQHTTAPLDVMIVQYSIHNDINYETSLRIAMCESKMGKYKYNMSGSSAKGIFQFIDRTWGSYCEGDVLNDEDNVRCFTELYKQHPSWWQCK